MENKTIDGTTALKVEFFENVGIELNENVENFRSGLVPRNHVLELFKRIDKLPFSNLDIRFSDDTWDFSAALTLPIENHKYIFKFNKESSYCDVLKMYVLNEVLRKSTKIRTIKENYSTFSKTGRLSKITLIMYKL